MRICAISDTHNYHREIDSFIRSNNIDILIHSGDGADHKSPYINQYELRNCLVWMESFKDIPYKIYVPGNHDTSFEKGLVRRKDFMNINFLIDDWIKIDTGYSLDPKDTTHKKSNKVIKIHGSPFTPSFGTGWAYNCGRSTIQKHWNLIEEDTNILVTHGPPKGLLDTTTDFSSNLLTNVGCSALTKKVLEVQPDYHIFGHLHDEKNIFNHGIKMIGDKCKTKFINASICELRGRMKFNKPILFEI